MSPIETLRTKLIDKILVTENEQLLKAIDTIFSSTSESEIYQLDSYQVEMLEMSERDIHAGDIISEEDLSRKDKQWMN